MKYRFSLNPYDQKNIPIKYYGLNLDALASDEWVLRGMSWWDWTPEEIQKIIDKSIGLVENEEYIYQVVGSDLFIIVDKVEVHFFDVHSEQEEADLIWSFKQFIDFMEQFKAFVAENS